MSDSLQPHGLRHARLPCPSQLPATYYIIINYEISNKKLALNFLNICEYAKGLPRWYSDK